jgi:hypothetical protein
MTITGRKSQVEKWLVGPNGLEPSTSSVSGRRSNQLSYGPIRALRLLLPTVPAIQETTHHATVSRMRSNQTELRAYMDGCGSNSTGWRAIRATFGGGDFSVPPAMRTGAEELRNAPVMQAGPRKFPVGP